MKRKTDLRVTGNQKGCGALVTVIAQMLLQAGLKTKSGGDGFAQGLRGGGIAKDEHADDAARQRHKHNAGLEIPVGVKHLGHGQRRRPGAKTSRYDRRNATRHGKFRQPGPADLGAARTERFQHHGLTDPGLALCGRGADHNQAAGGERNKAHHADGGGDFTEQAGERLKHLFHVDGGDVRKGAGNGGQNIAGAPGTGFHRGHQRIGRAGEGVGGAHHKKIELQGLPVDPSKICDAQREGAA